MKHIKLNIPTSLILFRLLLAPLIISIAYLIGEPSRATIVVLMYLGLLSDILDGVFARKLNMSSAKLRRMDSQTDTVFWIAICIATWILNDQLITENGLLILSIIGMEVLCELVSLLKFKKESSSHSYLAKAWGLSLLVAFTALIGFNHAGIPFKIAITIGFIAHVERILITLILPNWAFDIPTVYHAYKLRKQS